MRPAPKPRWQQATALVSLGAGGVVTGLSFVPGSPADLTSPATLPFALMALEKSAQAAPSDGAMLRSAIVHVARHYLGLAERKTPAEMEAIIWQHDSLDGADHGPSCAAFASLTLELGSHLVGQQSWVTGGTSYPWPLHHWVDARVGPNPASPEVVSVLEDAQHHQRWHALGDGYEPQPGDWVLFDGHVEVVTKYAGGVLHTIGGDSLPNFSVNAHEYPGPLSGQGVVGFVDNGLGPAGAAQAGGQVAAPGVDDGLAPQVPSAQAGPKSHARQAGRQAPGPAKPRAASATTSPPVLAPRAIPVPPAVMSRNLLQSRALAESGAETSPEGAALPHPRGRGPTQNSARVVSQPQKADHPRGHNGPERASQVPHLIHGRKSGRADIPATSLQPPAATPRARPGQAQIPGVLKRVHRPAAAPRGLAPYQRHQHAAPAQPTTPGSAAERAFIEQVAPGAMATQRRYGVPASVTIAQAIDESGWGQSILATQDHNLFGIKGSGPAGSDLQPTQEFIGGQLVDSTAPFRMYYNIGQSIEAHGKLLARSDYFTNAMANKRQPNAFAAALTGIYATDPSYGVKLVGLMQRYDLYRFDAAAETHGRSRTATGAAAIPGITGHANPAHDNAAGPAAQIQPSRPAQHGSHPARPPDPAPNPAPGRTPSPAPTGQAAPRPVRTPGAAPTSGPTSASQPLGETGTAPANVATPARQPLGTPNTAQGPGTTAAAQPLRRNSRPNPAQGGSRQDMTPSSDNTPTTAGGQQPRGPELAPASHSIRRAKPGPPPDARQTPGPAAAAESTPVALPGRAPGAAQVSVAGHRGPSAPAQRPVSNRGSGHQADSARAVQRSGSPAPGAAPDPAVPGTSQVGLPAGRPGAESVPPLGPGEADIPGLPQTGGSPTAHPAHRTRIGPRMRPAHPPANAGRTGPTQPVATARPASGYQGSPPAAPAPPAIPHPAGQAAGNTGRAHPGPIRGTAAPGAAMIPGLPSRLPWPTASGPSAAAAWPATGAAAGPSTGAAGARSTGAAAQPSTGSAAEPSTGAATGLGDIAIPGLQPTATTPAGRSAHDADAVSPGGAWIPGLPGQISHTAGDRGHATGARQGSGAARTGSGAAPYRSPASGAAHGSDLPPTHARRLGPGGQRPTVPGHGAAPAGARPGPASGPASAPGSPAPAAPVRAARPAPHAPGSPAPVAPVRAARPASHAPGSTPGAAADSTRVAAPRSADRAGPAPTPASARPAAARPSPAPGAPASAPASPPPSAAGTPFGAAMPDTAPAGTASLTVARYSHHLPPAVGKAFLTSAKVPLIRGASLYVDVASLSGIPWEILAACDWMQCRAKHGLSPVYGERLGAVNPDGTSYRTRSAALERCSYDLVELAGSVYEIDLTRSYPLSVRELANVFAAFRWGGLLKAHHTSAMEFPYSVAGLTTRHMHMRWPNIDDPQAPDKPGTKFHRPFGAVPVVLSLDYPATA